jgi:hypothetical protein
MISVPDSMDFLQEPAGKWYEGERSNTVIMSGGGIPAAMFGSGWNRVNPATGSHGILQETCGKVAESCTKTPEIAGTMEAVFRLEIVWIFSGGFLSTSCAFRQETARNHRKKSGKFPVGILLPQNHRNYREPAVFGPVCSTWACSTNCFNTNSHLNIIRVNNINSSNHYGHIEIV